LRTSRHASVEDWAIDRINDATRTHTPLAWVYSQTAASGRAPSSPPAVTTGAVNFTWPFPPAGSRAASCLAGYVTLIGVTSFLFVSQVGVTLALLQQRDEWREAWARSRVQWRQRTAGGGVGVHGACTLVVEATYHSLRLKWEPLAATAGDEEEGTAYYPGRRPWSRCDNIINTLKLAPSFISF
jgi:hypothetical protein